MKRFRHVCVGIVGAVLVLGLFVACTSDGEERQAQPQQVHQAEQEQTQKDQQQTSIQLSGTDDDQSQIREQADQASQEQQQEKQQAIVQSRGGNEEEEQSAVQPSGEAHDQQQKAQQESEPNQPQIQQQIEQQHQDQPAADLNTQEQEMQPEEEESEQPQEPSEAEDLQLRAEQIRAEATVTDLVGLNGWLNGEETSIALELAKGNIVLIDFWTYTCINCIRTLPFLTAWDKKYRDHGLVIIGVHTPEFEFEERVENLRAAIAEHDIEYLVAIDNDYRTWRAFQNRWWPRKFLIGPADDGSPMGIRYDHIGEGDYEETEHAIRESLTAVGKDLSDVPFGVEVAIPSRQGGTPRQTRELYAGWRRNNGSGGPYAGQDAYFLAGPDIDTFYHDIDTTDRGHNLWYLQGLWRIEEEAIVHARETDNLEDYIALLVRGRTANVVLTVAEDGRPFNVYVELDGRWLLPNEAGAHVQWDDQGRSYIRVSENDLYRLLFLPEWSEHELTLRSDSDQFRIFAFTFGSYVGGE